MAISSPMTVVVNKLKAGRGSRMMRRIATPSITIPIPGKSHRNHFMPKKFRNTERSASLKSEERKKNSHCIARPKHKSVVTNVVTYDQKDDCCNYES